MWKIITLPDIIPNIIISIISEQQTNSQNHCHINSASYNYQNHFSILVHCDIIHVINLKMISKLVPDTISFAIFFTQTNY